MVATKLTPFAAILPIPIGDLFKKSTDGAPIPMLVEQGGETIKEGIKDKFSISEWLGIKDKINELAQHMHQKALLTPDPNDDKIDFIKDMYNEVGHAPLTHFAPDWIKDIIIYITAVLGESTHDAIQWIFKSVYSLITDVVLCTPEWLTAGAWFSDSIFKFSTINVSIVVLLTMIEGIKRMFNLKHTSLSHIMKKLPIALGVSATAPVLFSWGIKILNKITKWIVDIGEEGIVDNKILSIYASSYMFEPINIVMMIAFIILVLALCVPLFLFHGRRWFNMLTLGLLTPFAMTAYLFKDFDKYFRMWLNSIKDLGSKQLIYAFFTTILGLIMFATPNPTTVAGIFAKMLVMIGGMHTLAYPPSFVRGYGHEKGIISMIKDLKEKGDSLLKQKKNYQEKTDKFAKGTVKIASKAYKIKFK